MFTCVAAIFYRLLYPPPNLSCKSPPEVAVTFGWDVVNEMLQTLLGSNKTSMFYIDERKW